jgi:hypoxanthine phosphoribosyltransferase
VPGGRVVIVDEVDDTRLTLSKCIEALREAKPAAIAAAVVHNKAKPKKAEVPDDVLYVVGEEVGDVWLHYPWDGVGVVGC